MNRSILNIKSISGTIFFWIGRELFSGQSPSGVYGKAYKTCLNNIEVET